MFRSPRTTQERRANGRRSIHVDGEYVVRLRPCRSMRNLVDAWDDVFRNDWSHRSWKRHRKTQYRGK